jgi:hypothetical protein
MVAITDILMIFIRLDRCNLTSRYHFFIGINTKKSLFKKTGTDLIKSTGKKKKAKIRDF